MIDVVFQLLIFFICTASFQAAEELLPATLSAPSTSGATVEPIDPKLEELEPIVIKVLAEEGRVYWRIGEALCRRMEEVRGVLGTLAQVQGQLPVILDIQGEVPVGDAVSIYDVCLLSGFSRVQFAAKVR